MDTSEFPEEQESKSELLISGVDDGNGNGRGRGNNYGNPNTIPNTTRNTSMIEFVVGDTVSRWMKHYDSNNARRSGSVITMQHYIYETDGVWQVMHDRSRIQ